MTSQKASLISSFSVRISVSTDKCKKDLKETMVRGIVVLNEDRLILSETRNGLKCFDSNGTPLSRFRYPSPTAMTRMSDNMIAYVVPSPYDPIAVFVEVDIQSGRLSLIESVRTPMRYRAIASIDEETWVAGSGMWYGPGAINVSNTKGEVLRSYDLPDDRDDATVLLQSIGNLVVNHNGDFVVADVGKILWVNPKTATDDNPIRFTFDGAKEGLLKMPCGVACDSQGRVYVTDVELNHVIVLSSDGKYIQTILDAENGELCKPVGVDLHQDKLYVAEKDGFVKVFQLSNHEEPQSK